MSVTGIKRSSVCRLPSSLRSTNPNFLTGVFSELSNVTVRGIGSVSGGSSPLYVVDGIPSEKYPNLNPNDIESMEVLKDASAAAIYGSRANAGVVLITTKSCNPLSQNSNQHMMVYVVKTALYISLNEMCIRDR